MNGLNKTQKINKFKAVVASIFYAIFYAICCFFLLPLILAIILHLGYPDLANDVFSYLPKTPLEKKIFIPLAIIGLVATFGMYKLEFNSTKKSYTCPKCASVFATYSYDTSEFLFAIPKTKTRQGTFQTQAGQRATYQSYWTEETLDVITHLVCACCDNLHLTTTKRVTKKKDFTENKIVPW